MNTTTQFVEIFHLIFLDFLGRKLPKEHYALKGGCNLRFYLKSIRYSQDMDIDIKTVKKETLANIVNRIMESQPFKYILKSKQIEVVQLTESKQTDTTQRWKIQLRIPLTSLQIPTKIEFSRRGKEEDTPLFELIDSNVTGNYQLTPFYASHYTMETAFKQKIWALILRTETQARDIFDLFHLINCGVKQNCFSSEMINYKAEAEKNAFSISYEAYKSQVVSYLPIDYQQQYSDPNLWDKMVLQVVEAINKCN